MRPSAGTFGTIDPAPPARASQLDDLRAALLAPATRLFEKYRAIFALRNQNTPESAVVIGEALLADSSALLRHECAYVLGQMQQPSSFPYLLRALETDEHAMVRHESAEALGALGGADVEAALKRALQADPAVEVRESCELALQHLEYLRDPGRLDF